MNHKEELLKWFDTEMAEQDQDVHPEARQSVLALNKECQVFSRQSVLALNKECQVLAGI